MLDIVVSGGFVVDGTGAPGRNADIGVNGDRTAAIGNLRSGEASLTLDVAEMVVAPGFVDIHSHSDFRCSSTPGPEPDLPGSRASCRLRCPATRSSSTRVSAAG